MEGRATRFFAASDFVLLCFLERRPFREWLGRASRSSGALGSFFCWGWRHRPQSRNVCLCFTPSTIPFQPRVCSRTLHEGGYLSIPRNRLRSTPNFLTWREIPTLHTRCERRPISATSMGNVLLIS